MFRCWVMAEKLIRSLFGVDGFGLAKRFLMIVDVEKISECICRF